MGSAVQAFAQGAPKEPMPMGQLRALAQAFDMLRTGLPEPPAGSRMLEGAIRGMVREADPEAGEYYTEEELRSLRDAPADYQASVGVQLFRRGDQMALIPLAGGPAAEAGLRPGDVLLAVDRKPVGDLRLHEVVAMLRGPVQSKVSLTVLREFAAQSSEVDIERRPMAARDFDITAVGGDLMVLKLHNFNESTLTRLPPLLAKEWSSRPWRGLVLDLRGNPGGLLQAAVGVTAMFLPERAEVVRTSGRLPQASQSFRAIPADYQFRGRDPLSVLPRELRDRPMVVLVDRGSAAGSEIVAAALKDHGRALIVGRTTMGRGSIQTQMPLDGHGAIKMTTAYWETPSGSRIHKVGVQPDEPLASGLDAAQELAAAISALRRRMGS